MCNGGGVCRVRVFVGFSGGCVCACAGGLGDVGGGGRVCNGSSEAAAACATCAVASPASVLARGARTLAVAPCDASVLPPTAAASVVAVVAAVA